MSESTSSKTINGHEISQSREVLSFDELKSLTAEYGLDGVNPQERLMALKSSSPENTAFFLTDLNRRLQGSDETLVHEEAMKIGNQETIAPDKRYDIFNNFISEVQNLPDNINPGRVGDALALATVLLHPFKDGNGRTSRVVGFLFKDYYDAPDAYETFEQVAQSREKARADGDTTITVTYVPGLEGAERQDPDRVGEYLKDLLTTEDVRYMGLGGEHSSLIKEAS